MPWRLVAKSWLIAVLLAAAAQPLGVAGARAGYACRVPRALLCEGCATAIAITLQRDGSCRISFTPPASPTQDGAAPPPTDIDFQVEAPPAPKPAPRTTGVARSPRHVSWVRAAPAARCFVFNDQRYCE